MYNFPKYLNMKKTKLFPTGNILQILFLLIFATPLSSFSQQIVDPNYNPIIENPEYALKKGPLLYIDEGHYNFYTKEGQFKPFSNLLEKDGYNVAKYPWRILQIKLVTAKILVIANAVNAVNEINWELPTPSAFSKKEIEDIAKWVNDGGSLLLIADHMPMAGAATDLAAKFGFEFTNGFVFHSTTKGTAYFNKNNGSLIDNSLTKGRNSSENVNQIATFIGQGFKIPEDATPILVFDENYENSFPEKAWVFNKKTPKTNAKGLVQGAYKKYGKGRIAVFGEAAMFTAQLVGTDAQQAGMNSPKAPDNYKLLLNTIHWLDGKFD